MEKKENKLFLLIGLPGAGKSTYAKTKSDSNTVIVSSDEIRKELFGSDKIQKNGNLVFKIFKEKIKENLESGKNVFADATNMYSKDRKEYADIACSVGCDTEAVVIATPYEVVLQQNQSRDRVVPKDAIDRFLMNFQFPLKNSEGLEKITLYYAKDEYKRYYNLSEFIKSHTTYKIDSNRYKQETLAGLMLKLYERTCAETKDDEMRLLALLEFNGIPFAEEYNKENNKPRYEHTNCVGSYNALFFDTSAFVDILTDEKRICICQSI